MCGAATPLFDSADITFNDRNVLILSIDIKINRL